MRGEQYLTKREQYNLVYSEGKLRTGSLVSIRVIPNGIDFSRYGFVVSKRVGKAVIRNKIKRLLREILRQTSLKPGWDIVFYTHLSAANADFTELAKSIMSLLSRAQLLMENYEKACTRIN